MKKRVLLLWMVLLLVAGTVWGCGSNGVDNNDYEYEESQDTEQTEETEETEEVVEYWREAYVSVLTDVIAESGTYAFDQAEYGVIADYPEGSGYQYTLYDVDLDGIPEMFVKFNRYEDIYAPIRVFTCDIEGNVKEFEHMFYEQYTVGIMTSSKYMGVMESAFDRWSGTVYYSVYAVVNGELEEISGAEYTYDQTADAVYEDTWTGVEWSEAVDTSLLSTYVVGSEGQEIIAN